MSSIPAGYQLHVTSWENDGDNYATKILSGLAAEDVAFYVDLLSLFTSVSNGGFANDDNVDMESVLLAIREKLAAHPKLSRKIRKSFDMNDGDHIRETMYDLLGSCEYYDFRVFDSVKVFYFETPVKDVTKQFTKQKGK